MLAPNRAIGLTLGEWRNFAKLQKEHSKGHFRTNLHRRNGLPEASDICTKLMTSPLLAADLASNSFRVE